MIKRRVWYVVGRANPPFCPGRNFVSCFLSGPHREKIPQNSTWWEVELGAYL